MNLRNLFGIGEKRILEEGIRVTGQITAVHECWYIKINTKPARMNGMDGAMFPHIITFRYLVDGVEYWGRRWVSWNLRCPAKGSRLTVCCLQERPGRCTVIL